MASAATTMPAAPANLDDLPVVKGFRQRGTEMTRIETFTDAAFAFAMTLMIVSIWGEGLTAISELRSSTVLVPAFAVAAALIMVFWYGHHIWSRRFGLDDGPTILLSILLVFVVLVYVIPLRTMTVSMVIWVMMIMGFDPSGIPIHLETTGDIVESPKQINQLFVIYGVGFMAMGGVMVLLNAHAWRRREELQLNDLERHETTAEIGAWAILVGVGLLSVVVAMLGPKPELGVPGWVYMLLPIAMPTYGVRMNRRRDAILAAASS